MWTKAKPTESGFYWLRDDDGKDCGIRFILLTETNENSPYHPDFWRGWRWSRPLQCPPFDRMNLVGAE